MAVSAAAVGTFLGAGAATATAVGTMAIGATAAAGISGYNGYQANKQQKAATEQANKNSQAAAKAAEEANNKANQKRVNTAGLLSSNQAAAKGGQSGTMLTGPGGVDPSTLQLGKTTLLGGGG